MREFIINDSVIECVCNNMTVCNYQTRLINFTLHNINDTMRNIDCVDLARSHAVMTFQPPVIQFFSVMGILLLGGGLWMILMKDKMDKFYIYYFVILAAYSVFGYMMFFR